MLSPKILRLLSLALMASVLPMLGLYALVMYASMSTSESGMEPASSMVSYFAFTFLFGALIIVALNFSRQLAREAKGERQLP
jgi:TRAP-type C4-dicarboxylate transport system permease small subunit